jgi:hypothetical protein
MSFLGNYLPLSGGQLTGQLQTTTNAPILSTDTTAGAGAGPVWELYRNITGATNNIMGEILFTGKSAGGNKRTWGYIYSKIAGQTDANEYGDLYFDVIRGGAQQTAFRTDMAGNNAIILGTSVNSVLGNGTQIGMGYSTTQQIKFDSTGATITTPVVNANSTIQYMGAASGTDTITVTASPALTAYTTGAFYLVKSGGQNSTTTPTLNINGLGAKTIVKRASTALAAGDILNGMMCLYVYDGTNMELLNPVVN